MSKINNVTIHGAKNSALPIIAATLLDKKIYHLFNINLIADVLVQLNILKQFNVSINIINDNEIIIDTTKLNIPDKINYELNTRGTYYFIGSTIHYNKDIDYVLANGCNIDDSDRKIDFHIELIKLSGKDVVYDGNKLNVFGKFNNNNIHYKFKKPSVGATVNGLLMFSKIKSTCILENYARDPYITDLITFLQSIGIKIEYDNNKITIYGGTNIELETKTHKPIQTHHIIPDPIETITYIIFSAINLSNYSISPYTIGPTNIQILGGAIQILQDIGIELVESSNPNYFFVKRNKLNHFNIETDYYPKLYTDVQPFFCLLSLFIESTTSNSISKITETVWTNRFNYVHEINKLGYNLKILTNPTNTINSIVIDSRKFTKYNSTSLIDINCTDLRGGMAVYLLLMKLKIKFNLLNKKYIDRGYYNYQSNIDLILNSNVEIRTSYCTTSLSNINIGGICKYYSEFYNIEQLVTLINFCNENNIKYHLIGGGYNMYFSEYYEGMIIKNKYTESYANSKIISKPKIIQINNNLITIQVSSSLSLMEFVNYCADIQVDISSLAGIPGTIGGSIYGNAGAYGMEIKDLINSCAILKNNQISILDNKQMEFEYRSSLFKKSEQKAQTDKPIILSATFIIEKSELTCGEIKEKISNIEAIRNKKFTSTNTLGSIFKNPIVNNTKIYAWKLLDEINMRGVIIRNLKLSDINPNIFINVSNATNNDMNYLLAHIEKLIYEKYNIILEKEIEYIQ